MRLWIFLCTTFVSMVLGSCLAMLVIPSSRAIPAQILVKNDHPTSGGDAIILLMGDAEDRAKHAAQLLREGYGQKIVFVETERDELQKAGLKVWEGKLVYEYLTKILKVPADKIEFDSSTSVTSTQEEARAILRILEKHRYYRNTLATSWYHSSRADWIFHQLMAETKGSPMIIASYPSKTPENWYKREKDFLNVYMEYLKWVYYWVRYEVLN